MEGENLTAPGNRGEFSPHRSLENNLKPWNQQTFWPKGIFIMAVYCGLNGKWPPYTLVFERWCCIPVWKNKYSLYCEQQQQKSVFKLTVPNLCPTTSSDYYFKHHLKTLPLSLQGHNQGDNAGS